MEKYLRRPNGQFASKQFEDKYPTGRKHCAGICKRWRQIVDFSVAKWADEEKTIPLKLMSYCKVCVAEKQRIRKGHQRRTVFDGQVGTEMWHQCRLAKKREQYYCNRHDSYWVERQREMVRQRNREKSYAYWAKKEKRTKGQGIYDSKKFLAYLDRYIAYVPVGRLGQKAIFVNQRRASRNETRTIRHWRNEVKTIRAATLDKWAIRFGLPLWEIEEAAKIAV